MQDGYYFATSPWLIGDQQTAAQDHQGLLPPADQAGLRHGQIVRIDSDVGGDDAQPLVFRALAEPSGGDSDAVALPVILRPSDRLDAPASVPGPIPAEVSAQQQTVPDAVAFAAFCRQQAQAMDRLEQSHRDSVTSLEDRMVCAMAAMAALAPVQSVQTERLEATLTRMEQEGAMQNAALTELAAAFDRLTAGVDNGPRHMDQILRDMADMRAGLTELRVQARMIELQLFSLARGTDNPLARPFLTEPFGAMAETLAS